MKYIATILAMMLLIPSAVLAGPAQTTIIDKAIAVNTAGPFNGSFDILIAALLAEGEVAERLNRRGQYTVFAPTDAAFENLFVELNVTAPQVLADKSLLSEVLEYHVTRGRRDAADVTTSRRIRTLQRGFLHVDGAQLTDSNDRIANITLTNVFADNGVIHVIDRVVLP